VIRVVYPIPNESPEVWEIFKPAVERFCATWRKFPPGCECELVPVLFGDDPTGKCTQYFHGLPVDAFQEYRGGGCDIGAAQWVAVDSEPGDFLVALTSRVYFHRPNWLDFLRIARELYGKGLYGTSASMEGGIAHCCTRCYAMDCSMWNSYPFLIESRDQGTFFEVGANNPIGSLNDWVEAIGLPTLMVYGDGVRPKPYWFSPENIFRRGDQSNLLVWDKHTLAYREADREEQLRLQALAYGLDTPVDGV